MTYGINKQQDFYNYFFELKYDFELNNNHKFEILTNYYGNTLKNKVAINRDDLYNQFNYYLKLNNNFNLLTQTEIKKVNYPGSLILSNIDRYNLKFGIKYNDNSNNLIFVVGPENNNQDSYLSNGIISNFFYENQNINLKNLSIKIKTYNEFLSLDRERNNINLNFLTNAFQYFNDTDNLNFDIMYKFSNRYNLYRRDLNYITQNNLDFDYNIEKRMNNFLRSSVIFNQKILENLYTFLEFGLDKNLVNLSYNEFVKNDYKTGITQIRDNVKYLLNSSLTYNEKIVQNILKINYYNEIDNYSIETINSIPIDEKNKFQNQAFDMNLNQSNLNIQNIFSMNISINDSINIITNSNISRLDTPSPRNNSERDELIHILSLNYYRKINYNLKFQLTGDYQYYHLVNLKSQLSSSNYSMRNFRIITNFNYKTNELFLRPSFLINANYTVYDFENLYDSPRSFSIRQLGYSDSINIKVVKNIYLIYLIDMLYKETGILYWNEFSEFPLNSNVKYFLRSYINYNTDDFQLFTGFRYYNIKQKNLSKIYGLEYSNLSIAPEVTFSLNLNSNFNIFFNGWYEYQFINNTLINKIPNFFLKTSFKL